MEIENSEEKTKISYKENCLSYILRPKVKLAYLQKFRHWMSRNIYLKYLNFAKLILLF